MGRFIRAAAVLGALAAHASGCAQIAGIEETSGTPATGVSLSLDRLSIGATLVRAELDITGQTATYLADDAAMPDGLARTAAEQVDANTWTAAIPEGAPPVVFTLPGVRAPRLWALGVRDVVGELAEYGHPDPTPAPAPATVSVSATLPSGYAVGETFELYSVGAWVRRELTPPSTIGALEIPAMTYDYATFQPVIGGPLPALTLDDAHAVLRYEGVALTGVLEVAPFAQTGNDMISGAMVAVPRDQVLSVTLDPGALTTRFVTQLPAMSQTSLRWAVRSAPGAAAGYEQGPSLVSGVVDAMTPQPVTAMYGNPFVGKGWPAVFALTVAANRTYTDPATSLTVPLNAVLTQVVPAGDVAAGEALDVPAGMPQLIAIGDTPLTTDGLSLPRPTVAPVITFTTDRPDATLYELTIFQLVPNAGLTAIDRVPVLSALGVSPVFTVPPELFEAGASYFIRASSSAGGWTSVATGDLTQRSLPTSRAAYDSGVFTVTP